METTAQEPQTQYWYSYQEAAAELGCSTKTIARRVQDRTVAPQLRHGKRGHWFTADDIAVLRAHFPANA